MRGIVWVGMLLLLSNCGGGDKREIGLIIATAANMHFAMKALAAAFEELSVGEFLF